MASLIDPDSGIHFGCSWGRLGENLSDLNGAVTGRQSGFYSYWWPFLRSTPYSCRQTMLSKGPPRQLTDSQLWSVHWQNR